MPKLERLDVCLASKGFFDSREKAQRAVMAGSVTVNGVRAEKPGQRVPADALIEVASREKYVGRGGLKLEAALRGFGLTAEGKTCLDIGASTGGFTDCLLQHGALKVHAVDVGHGQLDWKIRNDPRVVVYEGLNARALTIGDIGERVDFCVADVSFISLALILGPAFELLRPESDIVVLIKPQFELSREEVAQGGVVRDESLHRKAVEKIRTHVLQVLGRQWLDCLPSPITGRDGNVEFLAHLKP